MYYSVKFIIKLLCSSRAQIYKILDDKVVEVLFVDIGELNIIKRNSLLTIHPDLIIQLPFQVNMLSGLNLSYYYLYLNILTTLYMFMFLVIIVFKPLLNLFLGRSHSRKNH